MPKVEEKENRKGAMQLQFPPLGNVQEQGWYDQEWPEESWNQADGAWICAVTKGKVAKNILNKNREVIVGNKFQALEEVQYGSTALEEVQYGSTFPSIHEGLKTKKGKKFATEFKQECISDCCVPNSSAISSELFGQWRWGTAAFLSLTVGASWMSRAQAATFLMV